MRQYPSHLVREGRPTTPLALIRATDKEKDWKVTVTGKVSGQTMTVESIKLE